MAESTYKYSIFEVEKDQVLSKIATYGYHMFAVKIDDNTVLQSDKLTVDELAEMVKTNDYLYFYVKKKEVK